MKLSAFLDRICIDKVPAGPTWQNPGLDQALSVVHSGNMQRFPKLDCLTHSVPDAHKIADALQTRGVKLAQGTDIYGPANPMGKIFFNMQSTFTEPEGSLVCLHTPEGMTVVRSKGKPVELFSVFYSTVYRLLTRTCFMRAA